MVNAMKLKGAIVSHGKTQAEVAKFIGITPKTFTAKMKKGVFNSNEIEGILSFLEIEDMSVALDIFFDEAVTCGVTTNEQV